MFRVEKIKKIKDIDVNEWNRLTHCNVPHMNYQYLKSIEESLFDIYEFSYLLIYKENVLVATTMIFIDENFYLDTPLLGSVKRVFSNIRRIKKNFLRRKALFCGCPISEFNCINLDESIVFFKDEIVQIIIDELNKIAKDEKIKIICFKDLKCKYINNYEKLISNGYTRLFSLPGTELKIEFNTFEEYLKTLKKKYRSNIKNKINKNSKHKELSVEVIEDFEPYIPKMYEIYLNTYKKSEIKFEKLSIDFFYNIKKNIGDNVVVILCKYDGEICGSTVLVNTPTICVNLRIGLDYSKAYKYNIYFLMLYQNIQYAIDTKKERILLSQTSYRPKLELGADIVPLSAYIKFNNSITHRIYSLLLKIFFRKYEILSNHEKPLQILKEIYPNYYN